MQIHYYSPAQQVMHWLTVILMFSILPVAWILDSVIEETPAFFFWMDVHEAIGLTILGLTTLRIVWRIFDCPLQPIAVSQNRVWAPLHRRRCCDGARNFPMARLWADSASPSRRELSLDIQEGCAARTDAAATGP